MKKNLFPILSQFLNETSPTQEALSSNFMTQEKRDYFYFKQHLISLITIEDNPSTRAQLKHFVSQHRDKIQSRPVEFSHFLYSHFVYRFDYEEQQTTPIPFNPARTVFCFELIGDLMSQTQSESVKMQMSEDLSIFLIEGLGSYVDHVENNDLFFFFETPGNSRFINTQNFYTALYAFSELIDNLNMVLSPRQHEGLMGVMCNLLQKNWKTTNNPEKDALFECVEFFKHAFCNTPEKLSEFQKILRDHVNAQHDYFTYQEKFALNQSVQSALSLGATKTFKI